MHTAGEIENSAREEAQKQWNNNPCGAVPTDEFDSGFFQRVEAERYRQQYWQQDFFDYNSFGGKAVLEIGVGLGTDLKQFARGGAQCHGADITDRHLELTKLNFEFEGYPVDLRKADAAALPFPDNYFDCVYSFGVLHHIPDVSLVISEIRRVLKPGGMLQTAVYHRYSLATCILILRFLFDGSLRRLGLERALTRIEMGADGVDIRPYVKLYSRREWQRLIERSGFATHESTVRQVHFDRAKVLNSLRPAEALLGWYVCGKFIKAI